MASLTGIAYDLARALPLPPAVPAAPAACRAAMDRTAAIVRPFSPRSVASEWTEAETSAGPVPVLVQSSATGIGAPVMLFLHGGGYMCGSARSHATLTARLARITGATVVSPDYRLAPEHPYPAAYDDALAVLEWLVASPYGPAADPSGVVLAGDSAGAALALGTAVAARDSGVGVAGVVCLYGWFDFALSTPQFARLGPGDLVIPTPTMQAFAAAARDAPDFLAGDYPLEGLAPVYLVAGDRDPLFEDSVLLARRCEAAGVRCDLVPFEGMPHGFCTLWPFLPTARRALAGAAAFVTSVTAAAPVPDPPR